MSVLSMCERQFRSMCYPLLSAISSKGAWRVFITKVLLCEKMQFQTISSKKGFENNFGTWQGFGNLNMATF